MDAELLSKIKHQLRLDDIEDAGLDMNLEMCFDAARCGLIGELGYASELYADTPWDQLPPDMLHAILRITGHYYANPESDVAANMRTDEWVIAVINRHSILTRSEYESRKDA